MQAENRRMSFFIRKANMSFIFKHVNAFSGGGRCNCNYAINMHDFFRGNHFLFIYFGRSTALFAILMSI